MLYKTIFFFFLLVLGTTLTAQTRADGDTIILKNKSFPKPIIDYIEKTVFQYLQKSDQAPSNKAFNYSLIGGPYYTNETKVGMGLLGSGLFRLNGSEMDSIPSNVSLYTNFTSSGAYAVGIKSSIYFPQKKYWIDADISFSDTPSQYWGVGYIAGRNSYYTDYNIQDMQVKVNLFKKIDDNISVGLITNARDIRGKYFDDKSLLNGEKRKITVMGAGITMIYDSRDIITEPHKGIYAKLGNVFYPNFSGNTSGFNKTEIAFRYYKQVWEGSVVAFDLGGQFNRSDVPWNLMAQAGDASQMRGYYTGQYRNRNFIESQIEFRQHIYKRSGIAAWVGAGNVFPRLSDFKLKQTLPTVGLGYRFRVKERTNLRIDYGVGKGQSAFYININEAF